MSQQAYAEAMSALQQGDWVRARALGTHMLQAAPYDPRSYFVAGVAASRQQQMPLAIGYLRRACLLDPDRAEYLAELARAYVTAGHVPEAVATADRAMLLAPRDGTTFDMLGVIFGQAGFHERARHAFECAVRVMPGSAASRFNLGSSLMFAGEVDAAESEFEACLRIDPRHWRAYLFLSQVRRQTAQRNHVDQLQDALAGEDGQLPQVYLNLALAKELEDLGSYEESFGHLVAGKTAGGLGRDHSTQRDIALFDAIIRCFPEPMAEAGGFDTDEPIFVIGMPRTGTTLVERILSSHPEVHSAGELRNFVIALKEATGGPADFIADPALPARVAQIDWRRLGERYLASTRPGTGHMPRFVDKFPHNFLYAGFIARALPRARIICLRRGAADTCLSNFRQLFALNSPYFDYAFDLLDTGRYYLLFDRLMAHWQRVLPGRILELSYEALVDDQEASTRRLLEHCGLSWNDACLRFEENAAPVATASTIQVREPMNRNSIGRWRRYEPQLSELIELLAANGIPPGA
jgi:Flp pilus assembly protein TadD